jgi:choline dehydrogenase-like flavoprotein
MSARTASAIIAGSWPHFAVPRPDGPEPRRFIPATKESTAHATARACANMPRAARQSMASSRPAGGCYCSAIPLYSAYAFNPRSVDFLRWPSFPLSSPAETAKLPNLVSDCEGAFVAATCGGRRRALTTPALLRALVALPLLTLKIVAARCWEALRLWLQGVRIVPKHIATANAADMSLAGSESHAYIPLRR